MCGIAGLVRLAADAAPLDRDRLRAATAALRHRGPDDEGFYLHPDAGFGFRRLSIVDVAGGRQPVPNEDRTVWVVHNGEIYNHAELRAELTSKGHRFASRTDAETLVHGYEAWGLDGLLARLQGMFAFAIWDERNGVLHAARDRFGMKPFYFATHAGWFGFASEVGPLRLLLSADDGLDHTALAHYLRLGYVPAPRTLHRGFRKLPAAHCLTVANGKWASRCYWRLQFAPLPVRDEQAAVAEFRDRLGTTVAAHLMGDVPVGALLSGGVDSATVVAHMRLLLPESFPVVTIGFGESQHDERDRALACARELGLSPTIHDFGAADFDDYPAVLAALGEPHAAATFTAQYRLFTAVRQLGLKVTLTGEGADELLGGYDWHWRDDIRRGWWNRPRALRRLGSRSSWCGKLLEQLRLASEQRRVSARDVADYYLRRLAAQPAESVQPLLDASMRDLLTSHNLEELRAQWEEWAAEAGSADPFQQLLWLQSRTRLPDYINAMFDRMSMANSVEARPPFQDHRLWEFCAGLPRWLKLRNDYPWQTEKYLLREAGRGLVPEVARTAQKHALQVPYQVWLTQPRLPDWAEDHLGERALRAAGLFDAAAVAATRQRACAGDAGAQQLLRLVLATQTWWQTSGPGSSMRRAAREVRTPGPTPAVDLSRQ